MRNFISALTITAVLIGIALYFHEQPQETRLAEMRPSESDYFYMGLRTVNAQLPMELDQDTIMVNVAGNFEEKTLEYTHAVSPFIEGVVARNPELTARMMQDQICNETDEHAKLGFKRMGIQSVQYRYTDMDGNLLMIIDGACLLGPSETRPSTSTEMEFFL